MGCARPLRNQNRSRESPELPHVQHMRPGSNFECVGNSHLKPVPVLVDDSPYRSSSVIVKAVTATRLGRPATVVVGC